jgi:hypothetical protein
MRDNSPQYLVLVRVSTQAIGMLLRGSQLQGNLQEELTMPAKKKAAAKKKKH